MKKENISITKNHKITKKKKIFFDGVPLKGYVASEVIFVVFAPEMKKKRSGKIKLLMMFKYPNITNM